MRQGKLINGQASTTMPTRLVSRIGDSVVLQGCIRSVVAALPFRFLVQQVHSVSGTCERQRYMCVLRHCSNLCSRILWQVYGIVRAPLSRDERSTVITHMYTATHCKLFLQKEIYSTIVIFFLQLLYPRTYSISLKISLLVLK